MASNGDIVFQIGADVTGLTNAGRAGEKSLADMERSAKLMERQLGKLGEAGVAFQREMNKLTGVTRDVAKSARDSAAAFEAFDRSRTQVDNLRASIDPLFAASKRYEAALTELDGALELGSISAREHASMVDLLSASYLHADGAAAGMGTKMGLLGSMSDGTKSKMQQVGFQVQDFAVQVGAGTSATQAFAQQFPQLAGAFGPVGIAIGTLAAVGIPLLSAAFAAMGTETKSLDDIIGELEASVTAFDGVAKQFSAGGLEEMRAKYGEVDAAVLSMIQRQREMAEQTAMTAAREAVAALSEEYRVAETELNFFRITGTGAARDVADALDLPKDAFIALQVAIRDLESATTFQQQADALGRINALLSRSTQATSEFAQKALEAEDAMRQLAASVPGANWLSGMISQASTLGKSIWDAVRAKAALTEQSTSNMTTGSTAWAQNSLGFTLPGTELIPTDLGGGSSEGGGGGANPMQGRIDALLQSLKTEEEIITEWYAQSLEALNAASASELEAIGGKHAAIERLEQEHQDRLAGIRDMGNQWGVKAALDGGAAILGAMASTNKQAQKLQSIFAAASALMSTYQGAAKELEKGTFGFASAAAVIAKGIGFVAAIKSAGNGGSGAAASGGGSSARSSGGTPSPSAPANAGTYLNFQFSGGWASQEAMGRFMVESINQAIKNGATIKGAKYT